MWPPDQRSSREPQIHEDQSEGAGLDFCWSALNAHTHAKRMLASDLEYSSPEETAQGAHLPWSLSPETSTEVEAAAAHCHC